MISPIGEPFSSSMSQILNIAAMLVEDLAEAGVTIQKVSYEEDADTGMKYYGGEYSPDLFLKQYEHVRSLCMGGMSYDISCIWNDIPFTAGIADNEYGKSCNRIVIRTESPAFDVNKLVSLLEK